MISSPYDLDVRYSQKRGTEWKGFMIHLTETCEPDRPNLITHVETTSATTADVVALDDIHDGLAAKGLLPAEHLADSAYMSAFELVKSRDRYGVEMVGPMRVDTSWQAADPDAFELAQFAVDWETERVTCPMGQQSYLWSKAKGPSGKPTVQANFPKRACQACAARSRCTRSASSGRTLTLHPRAEHEADGGSPRAPADGRLQAADTRPGRVWRGRSPRRPSRLGPDGRATGGSRRHTCSTSRRRRR